MKNEIKLTLKLTFYNIQVIYVTKNWGTNKELPAD